MATRDACLAVLRRFKCSLGFKTQLHVEQIKCRHQKGRLQRYQMHYRRIAALAADRLIYAPRLAV